MKIGVISDTHGLLRAEALRALEGSEAILHAGDVGDAAILEDLGRIAPATAIRGNIDQSGACSKLPATEWVELGGATFYLIHDLKQLDLDPAGAGIAVVVSGHSHQAKQERRKGVLYLNPGSAGPRRFRLPVTVARLVVESGRVEAEIVELEV